MNLGGFARSMLQLLTRVTSDCPLLHFLHLMADLLRLVMPTFLISMNDCLFLREVVFERSSRWALICTDDVTDAHKSTH